MDEIDNDESIFKFELSPNQKNDVARYNTSVTDYMGIRSTVSVTKRRRVSRKICHVLENVMGVAQSASIIRLKPKYNQSTVSSSTPSSPYSTRKKRKRGIPELDFAYEWDGEEELYLTSPLNPSEDSERHVSRSPSDTKRMRARPSSPSGKSNTLDDSKEKAVFSAFKQIMNTKPHFVTVDSTRLDPGLDPDSQAPHKFDDNRRGIIDKENMLVNAANAGAAGDASAPAVLVQPSVSCSGLTRCPPSPALASTFTSVPSPHTKLRIPTSKANILSEAAPPSTQPFPRTNPAVPSLPVPARNQRTGAVPSTTASKSRLPLPAPRAAAGR